VARFLGEVHGILGPCKIIRCDSAQRWELLSSDVSSWETLITHYARLYCSLPLTCSAACHVTEVYVRQAPTGREAVG
jgi:hypothetical protein